MEADEVTPVLTDFVRDWMDDKPELHGITIHKVIDNRTTRNSDVVGRICLNLTNGFAILGYVEDDMVEFSSPGEIIHAADPDFFDKLYERFIVEMDRAIR